MLSESLLSHAKNSEFSTKKNELLTSFGTNSNEASLILSFAIRYCWCNFLLRTIMFDGGKNDWEMASGAGVSIGKLIK